VSATSPFGIAVAREGLDDVRARAESGRGGACDGGLDADDDDVADDAFLSTFCEDVSQRGNRSGLERVCVQYAETTVWAAVRR
jgi:hypothetical protein